MAQARLVVQGAMLLQLDGVDAGAWAVIERLARRALEYGEKKKKPGAARRD